MMVIGAKGEPFKVPVVRDVEIESENKICLGDMLLVEEANYNLLGRDLMVALGINLIVKDSKLVVSLYKLTLEDEKEINPKVWYTQGEAGRLEMEPILIEIERPEDPIRVKQYTISLEGRRGLKPIIEDLIAKGILEPCMSRHNTPILAVRKADGSYRLVQDLRAVNERTKTRFPVVANPYTLLNRVSPEDIWYSVIDLKDAFWTCPLAEGSRDYFAFQWEDPDTNRKQQLRWASLPQGFVDSPNLFGQALEQLLSQFSPKEGTKILQYVDDLLIVGQEEKDVKACTISLLNFLGDKGLKVSKSKLQFAEPEAIVVVALLVEEAKKITFGAPLIVYTPHSVRTILQQKADKWLTDARLLKYEAILIHAPELELRTTTAKNPAEFLFGDASEGLTHNCAEIIELQTKIRADLEEEELEEGEKWFMDGSARVLEGKRKSGYAVIDGKTGKVVESGPLSTSWSAQACELYAVLQALKGLKGKNRIALDHLLAEEGGVCGKFNESECCIEIDDYGETIGGLAAEIKKVAHVPVQKWNSILQASWWDQLFGTGAWWKKVGFFILCSVAGVIFLPCLIPCLIRLIHTVVQGMQIAALPTGPELATGGLGKTSKISKIMKLNEERSRAAEVLAKFKARVKEEEEECRKYCDSSEEAWDDYKDDF
ncbi:hypothetical protein DUI87_00966 [Hirundo rustica rustica]|uniref:ribonuclease H n=1 Tax=Hirundo rustica rustica TaxID=333673 RepID=A0A3M0LAT0_HIRRU|nr:hypothetical protein DUI87_00962 [Hirundo rustica rustica]RMC20120.1 hypothetical protein DUI87_00966 [Hirundo rustica rustica]